MVRLPGYVPCDRNKPNCSASIYALHGTNIAEDGFKFLWSMTIYGNMGRNAAHTAYRQTAAP